MVMINKLVWTLPVLFLYILSCNNKNGLVQASHKVYLHYQTLPAVSVQKLHRTAYHFQPKKHWINDPNGPFFFNGYYHLMYQYNPKGAVWGNIIWAHSVSKDLINWIGLDPAIYPSKPFDKYGCWSGSTTVLPGNKPVILYTGIIDKLNTQVQNYAVPANVSDPFLREWVKPDTNPLIVAEKGINKTAFRDPTTGWMGADKQWRILIGGRNAETGISFLYKSKDFMKWVKSEKPLHSVDKTGNWECPDFFPVAEKGKFGLDRADVNPKAVYVHKVSLDATRFEYYTLGSYDSEMDIYTPQKTSPDNWKGLRLDYGNCYASKSFLDTQKNRRIMWSWANESDSAKDDVAKGWAGIMLIPRVIWLDPSGKQLLQWPVEELETLRRKKTSITNTVMKKGEKIEIKGIRAAQSDVEVTFSFPGLDKAEPFDPKWENLDAQDVCNKKGSFVQGGLGPFGLATLASQNLEEYTPVFFRVFKASNNQYKVLMCSDARKSTLKNDPKCYKPSFGGFVDVDLTKDKKISLKSLIDNSVVESFGGGGKTCMTSRVYPTLAVNHNAHLYVFNNGTEAITIDTLNAWTMVPPKQMN